MEINISSQKDLIDELEKELLSRNIIKEQIDRDILSKVDVIGFDIDHTLAIYNTENMISLLYSSFARYLIEHKNYPMEIDIYSTDSYSEDRKFNDDFVKKYSTSEVIIDVTHGNIINIDENKVIIKAFHGTHELPLEAIESLYGQTKEFHEFDFNCLRAPNYSYISGNFEYHVIPLFLICVHLLDDKILTNVKHYKEIWDDIIEGSIFNYILYDEKSNEVKDFRTSGYYFPEIYKHPEKYLYKYSAREMLQHLRNKGIHTFFATNSYYDYAHFIMQNTIGEDYLDLFEIGFYWAKKPNFFNKGYEGPGHFYSKINLTNRAETFTPVDLRENETFHRLAKEKIVIDGSYMIAEEFYKKKLNKSNVNFIYVGDNVNSDVIKPAMLENWKSIAVLDHISTGFIGCNPIEFKKMWQVESLLGNESVGERQSVFVSRVIRENALFTISNVDTLKHLK